MGLKLAESVEDAAASDVTEWLLEVRGGSGAPTRMAFPSANKHLSEVLVRPGQRLRVVSRSEDVVELGASDLPETLQVGEKRWVKRIATVVEMID